MSELSRMANMPVEVKVEGKTYQISELTLEDWAELDAWAEQQWKNDMLSRANLVKELDATVHRAILTRVATITRDELVREASPYMDSAEGSAYRLWLELKHKQPKITQKEAKRLLTFQQFNSVQRELLGIPSPQQAKDVKELLEQAAEALTWCSAAEDFQEGGKAHDGWVSIGRKCLEEINEFLEPAKEEEEKKERPIVS